MRKAALGAQTSGHASTRTPWSPRTHHCKSTTTTTTNPTTGKNISHHVVQGRAPSELQPLAEVPLAWLVQPRRRRRRRLLLPLFFAQRQSQLIVDVQRGDRRQLEEQRLCEGAGRRWAALAELPQQQ